jgi:hypothetical protein
MFEESKTFEVYQLGYCTNRLYTGIWAAFHFNNFFKKHAQLHLWNLKAVFKYLNFVIFTLSFKTNLSISYLIFAL